LRRVRRDRARGSQDLVEGVLERVGVDAPELGGDRREDRELVIIDLKPAPLAGGSGGGSIQMVGSLIAEKKRLLPDTE
jgi:hypothetical protein